MLQRYINIRDDLPKSEIVEIDVFLPSKLEYREIEITCAVIIVLDSVKKALQKKALNFSDSGALLDDAIIIYDTTRSLLHKSS